MNKEDVIKEIEELTAQLASLLEAVDGPEMLEDYEDNPYNWQSHTARNICYTLLSVADADGLGGCPLCQM